MAARVRRALILIAVLAVAAIVSPTASPSSRDAGQAVLPTLYVVYTMNCTFSIVDDRGKPVTTIPPGTYQVEVQTPVMFKLVVPGGPSVDQIASNDFTGCKGWVQFQLTGPGVNLSTTLDSGCDAFYLLPETTFKPNSTFTATDLNQPAVAHATFSTAATGTPVIPPSPYGKTSGKGSVQTQLAGSDANKAPLKGTLTGTLMLGKQPTLMSKGKAVSILKAGRYKFAITDQSSKSGVTLQTVDNGSTVVAGKETKALSGVSFVGHHSTYVTLTAGRWEYFSDAAKASYFLVTR